MTRKELMERQDELKHSMLTLLDLAENETRNLSDTENNLYQELENELRSITEQLNTQPKNLFEIKGETNMETRNYAEELLTGKTLELRAIDTTNKSEAVPTSLFDEITRKIKEIVPKEVWESAINEDVRVYLNHSDYVSIGQNVSIRALNDGVFLEMELRENELGILDAVKSNRLHSCSFGFVCTDEEVINHGDYYERTIKSMELKEISLLDREAAYNNTEIIEKRFLNVPFNQLELKRKKLVLLSI